ncbi:Mannosyl-oligosaccharide 1-2-alpha-mannosidase [Penicillium odoratum]|uniref:Mannosyl-oligosaccharide 1-2-alpha-mannosidase n=1 Tax=Penicillium odoratum TaxID=1167516 RepID=UPI002547B87B|nr:Mannosyl-oligosaccharide 1-2-alpha-mannosidase [Penicillium odoratum]KAJ5751806.1 Mannosyl-oligosaccharide 1-2-alpha-mannosidase [Penicillium odoratum]
MPNIREPGKVNPGRRVGTDVFHPVSKTGGQMSPSGLGWIIVDSLDTLMIMNLTTQLSDARKWLNRGLSYDQDQDVNTFETTIRMLGGLLSAHYLSTQLPDVSSRRDYIYMAKALDLADRLLSAYDTKTGIPYASVNIGTRKGLPSHTDGGASSTAEAATLQLEMKYLAQLTGQEVYWRKAEHIMEVLDGHRMQDGLLPIFVNPHTGSFHTKKSASVVAVTPTMGIGGKLSPKMDHLVCYLPGSIAIGATEGRTEAEACKLPSWSAQKERQMELARELMKTCWAMYAVTESGLAPEISWFEADSDELKPNSRSSSRPWPRSSNKKDSWKQDFNIRPADAHNLQRPETVESLFLMFRVTNDPIYRKWGWEIFKAFQKHTLVPDGEGYTSLHDVTQTTPSQRDNMESFWLVRHTLLHVP